MVRTHHKRVYGLCYRFTGNVADAEGFCRQQILPQALVVVKFKDALNDVSYPASAQDDAQLKKLSTRRLR